VWYRCAEEQIKGFTVAILKPDLVAAGKVDEVIERVRFVCTSSNVTQIRKFDKN
jgi:nucleoside diphosphate kinase